MTFHEITALSRHFAEADPADRREHGRNVDRLRELCAFVQGRIDPELAACLEATARLTEAMAGSSERLDRRSLHEIACRLLGTVEKVLQDLGRPAAGEEAISLAEPGTTAGAQDLAATTSTESVQGPATYEPKGDPALPKINNMVFGELVIELGWCTREQVERALDMHSKVGIPVGECLLVQGSATPEKILEALRIQERMRSMSAPHEPSDPASATSSQPRGLEPGDAGILVTKQIFLGEVLLGVGMITKDQLQQAMHRHHFENVRVGRALVELGALSEADLKRGLDIQRSLQFAAGLPAARGNTSRHSRRRNS